MAEGTVETETTEKLPFSEMNPEQKLEWLYDFIDALYDLANKIREKQQDVPILKEGLDGGLQDLVNTAGLTASKLGIVIKPREIDLNAIEGWKMLDFNRQPDIDLVTAYQASKGSKCTIFSKIELEAIRSLEIQTRSRGVK